MLGREVRIEEEKTSESFLEHVTTKLIPGSKIWTPVEGHWERNSREKLVQAPRGKLVHMGYEDIEVLGH